MRTKLELFREEVLKQYASNAEILRKNSYLKNEDCTGSSRKGSMYFYGAPFFKDLKLYSARPNADYLYRKKTLQEYFPMDFHPYTRPIFWVAKDKLFLIQGVKEQLIKHLNSQRNDIKRSLKKGIAAEKQEAELIECGPELHQMGLAKLMTLIGIRRPFKIDWFSISMKNLDNRHSPNECIGIWNGFLKPTLNRKPWTPEEELVLVEAAEKHSNQNWEEVAKTFTDRSAYQCLLHYQTIYIENNHIKHVRFTQQEDDLIMEMVEKYKIGDIIPWTRVCDKIPHRKKHQVYNR